MDRHYDFKRLYPRFTNIPERLPGRLIGQDPHEDLGARAVDVCRNGLGIITSRPLSPGENLWLVLPDRGIKLEVRHCREVAGATAEFRCGLQSIVAWEDLSDIVLNGDWRE